MGLAFLLVVIFLSCENSAARLEVTLTLDDPVREANVGPGGNGITCFTGNLTCNLTGVGQNTQTVLIELAANAQDWSVSVSPEEIEI